MMAVAVLFAAMVVYFVASLIGAAGGALRTTPAVYGTVSRAADFEGIAVRNELPVSDDGRYVFVAVDDGDAVARGQTIGRSMSSSEELEYAGREKELENEISRVKVLLRGITKAEDLTEHDSEVRSSILKLSRAAASKDLPGMDAASASLTALMFPGNASVTPEDLTALESELSAIKNRTGGSGNIKAESSGMFTAVTDGYENITPEALSGLDVKGCKALLNSEPQENPSALGKIITGFRWYYAGLIDSGDAGFFEPGDYVTVELPQRYGGSVTMRVDSVSDADGRKCAVVFSTLKNLEETVTMRFAGSRAVFFSQSGLRVPTKAIHVDDGGQTFVYVITAFRVEKKTVEILADEGDYSLVAVEDGADSLREGNEIVVSGKNVYEGLVISEHS